MSKEIGNDSFDVFPYVTLCALDIICGKSLSGVTAFYSNLYITDRFLQRRQWDVAFMPRIRAKASTSGPFTSKFDVKLATKQRLII